MPKLILTKLAQSYLRSNGHTGKILVGETTLDDLGLVSLYDICCDLNGNLYATDDQKHVIVKITSKGDVSIYAGTLGVRGNDGNTVKSASVAKFNTPRGIVCDKNGIVYVADSGNNQIRKIIPPVSRQVRAGDNLVWTGVVSLFCGSSSGSSGYSNAYPFLLDNPSDVALDNNSNLYVADTGNNCIRRFSIGIRKAVTVAGNGNVDADDISGFTVASRLNAPVSIDVNARGELYIADSGNYKIKKTKLDLYTGNFAGDGVFGNSIGLSTRFSDLRSVKCDKSGNIFVSDYSEDYDGRILRIDENGKSYFVKRTGYLDAFCFDNSGNFVSIENGYTTTIYSSSSSSSSSSMSSSSSSSYSSSSSSDSTNSSDSSLSSISSDSSSSPSSSSGPMYRYFNNANNDNNWNTLSNWWLDEAFTIPSDSLPLDGDVIHAYQPITTSPIAFVHLDELHVNNNDPHIHTYIMDNFSADVLNIEKSYLNGDPVVANVNCYLNSTIYSEVFGTHNFYNTSNLAAMPKWGTTNLYDDSWIYFGSTKGHVSFYDNSYNSQNGELKPTTIGAPFGVTSIYGSATFYNNSYNRGTIKVDTIFNDSSYMLGGTATASLITFNDDSSMRTGATINGNVVFNDNSYMDSGATINGDVTVNYPAQNPLGGTVNGTITYVGYPVNSSSSSSSGSSSMSSSGSSSYSSSSSSSSSNSSSYSSDSSNSSSSSSFAGGLFVGIGAAEIGVSNEIM